MFELSITRRVVNAALFCQQFSILAVLIHSGWFPDLL